MTPYVDGGFLLTLLIWTDGSYIAKKLLGEIELPLKINRLHQLQAENLLTQLSKSPERERHLSGEDGQRLWAWHFAEGLFVNEVADWENALSLAITWNRTWDDAPPPPLLLLHPALAMASGATHFLSFDPRARVVARRAELKLLPARL